MAGSTPHAACVPILLAGGIGSRLWPLSRAARPKQFLSPTGDATLLGQTLTRLAGFQNMATPILIGRDEHRFVLAEQLRESGFDGRILLEPAPRGTAAAIAAAAHEAYALHGADVRLLVLPTDHAIADDQAFTSAVEAALADLTSPRLALFGVPAVRPETGYGYIHAGQALAGDLQAENKDDFAGNSSGDFRQVERFVEKPDAETAATYVERGDHYWNSGMFLFAVDDYLAALTHFEPEIAEAAAAAHANATVDFDFLRLDAESFAASPALSIDYAVVERTREAVMVVLDAGWNDLGSWRAVARASDADERGNSVRGDAWLQDADNCLIYSDSRLVAALGTSDQIIVETADAVLVADREHEQHIGELVDSLKDSGRPEASTYPRLYRPWGSYEQIAAGPRFQVKHIKVSVGGQLSLQKHHYRAEHWVVVAGTARVTRDDSVFDLSENQSTFIPLGSVHRLENAGDGELDLIEVQSGSYLGEDDIVRFDDRYGRTEPDTLNSRASS